MPWNLWSLSDKRWMLLQSVGSKARAEMEIRNFPNPPKDLEARRVRPHLEEHGTGGLPFSPDAIWRMAMKDIEVRIPNGTAVVGRMKHYHFHRDHVRKASTPNDILRAALADMQKGRESGKRLTRMIYADEEKLKAALR